MNNLKVYIFSAIVLLAISAKGQMQLPDTIDDFIRADNSVEEKIEMLFTYAKKITFDDDITALYYYDSIFRMSEKLRNDSLSSKVYGNIGLYYHQKGIMDSAISYYKMAMLRYDISERQKNLIKARLGEALFRVGELDKAYQYLSEVIEFGEKRKDSILLISTYGSIGLIHNQRTEYDKAIDAYNKVFEFSELMDAYHKVVTHIRVGVVFFHLEFYDKARYHYDKALHFNNLQQYKDLSPAIFNNIARIFEEQKRYDSAIYYYTESIKFYKKNNQEFQLPSSYINIGNVYINQNNLQKASDYYMRAYRHPSAQNSPQVMTAVTINLGILNTKLERYTEAEEFLQKGMSNASKYDFRNFLYNAFSAQARLDSAQGRYLKALSYKDSMMVLQDSIWSDKLNQRIAAIEAQSNLKSKVLENKLLKKRDKANQKRLFYQKIALGLAALIVIGIIIFLVFIYRGRARLETMYNKLETKSEQIKQKNEQLEELNRTKDKFFSIISHDLKGPIGTLIALLEELEEDYDAFDEEERKDIIHNLRSSGQNTYNMLINLLDWSRSQRGAIHNKPQDTDLFETVDDVIGVLKERAAKKNITLNNSMAKHEVISYVDPEMIRTVFINLINNAIKFSHEHGIVEIGGERSNGLISVFVKDNGIGIPAEMMENLFQLNSIYQRRGTRNEKGTGLGLVLCHEFVLKMGGRITVKSSESNGSTFKITLPAKTSKTRPETIA